MNEQEKIAEFVDSNSFWTVAGNQLKGDFRFDTFEDAILFINRVASLASELNHHPTINNTYNRVSLEVCTHEAGNTLTALDLELAKRVSTIL